MEVVGPAGDLRPARVLAIEGERAVVQVLTDTRGLDQSRTVVRTRSGRTRLGVGTELIGRTFDGSTDLASIYERAGRLRGRPGSLTQLIILSMPDDDITHPVPDLTGYITEGQIVLSRELDRRDLFPPIDVLPSLSRLMNSGIGEAKTRADHRQLTDQLYASLARGQELRRLVSVVGEAALSEDDRRLLAFATRFEDRFVGQGSNRRTIEETLELGWELLDPFAPEQLTRLDPELVKRRHAGAA